MNLLNFLEDLSQRQISLRTVEDRLRCKAPEGVLTEKDRARLKQHKQEIMTLLNEKNAVSMKYPLSLGQSALWLIYKLSPNSPAYNIGIAFRIRSHVDIDALRHSFQTLMYRHPCLRTKFSETDNRLFQNVQLNHDVSFQHTDGSSWDENRLNKELHQAYRYPFDLENGPIMRIHLFTCSDRNHVLLWSMHHIISDGRSIWVMLSELEKLYPAAKADNSVAFPPIEASYSDFIQAQAEMMRSPESERLWDYWEKRLSGKLPVLNLPTDRIRPTLQTYNGASSGFTIDSVLTKSLKDLSRNKKVTLYMTTLAAFYALLCRYTGQEDILIGSPAEGRLKREWRNTVGYFANMVVFRADLSADPTFSSFLEQVRSIVSDAVEHQAYPFPMLVKKLQPDRDPGLIPLIQVTFLLNKPQESEKIFSLWDEDELSPMEWGGLRIEPFDLAEQEGQFDISLELIETGNSIAGTFKYNIDLYDHATITRMIEHFQLLLAGIIEIHA